MQENFKDHEREKRYVCSLTSSASVHTSTRPATIALKRGKLFLTTSARITVWKFWMPG